MDLTKENLQTILETINFYSIEEIEEILGIAKVKPLDVSDCLNKIVYESGDSFRDFYESELRQLFKELLEIAILEYD